MSIKSQNDRVNLRIVMESLFAKGEGEMGRCKFYWDDETSVAKLRILWSEGWSAPECAEFLEREFGGSLTRNAVLGKIHRLGLSNMQITKTRRPAAIAVSDAPKKQRNQTRNAAPKFKPEFSAPIIDNYYAPAMDDLAVDNIIPVGQRKQLFDLTESYCRWPIGDPGKPDFFFCGGDAIEGMPYCPYHCRVAYQPMGARWRDRRAA